MLRNLASLGLLLLSLLSACATPQEPVKPPGGGFAFAVVSVEFQKSVSREELLALDRVLRAREQIGTITRDDEGRKAMILYVEPRMIDFPALAADSAKLGLTVTHFNLRTSGTIVEHHCEACLKTRRFLKLGGTGQEFELESAKSQIGDQVLMEGEVLRWTSGRHLRIAAFGETKVN
jgi:hypothetical protein